jgi:hypothetical protein
VPLSSAFAAQHDISLILEVPTARKVALFLDQLADQAERGYVRFMSENIQQSHNVREILSDVKKDPRADE